ncbi:MAG: hypothetical protein DRJ05_17945, partial [Bacteroidetes bacterium]
MEEIKLRKNKAVKRKVIFFLIDLVIVTISFLIFIWVKPATISRYLPNYINPFLLFTLVWLFVSLLLGKFDLLKALYSKDVIVPVIISNVTILTISTTLIYSFGAFDYSRLVVFGTILLATSLEIGLAYLYFAYRHPVLSLEFDESPKTTYYQTDKSFEVDETDKAQYVDTREQIKGIITNESSDAVYEFISKYIDVGNPNSLTLSTTTKFNIEQLPTGRFKKLINLHRINDLRYINKFFEAVNAKLPFGGYFVDNAETYVLRRERILKKYPPVINHIYYFFDFIFTRVFPKVLFLKKIYFFVTLGRNRVLSKAEVLGRVYSCGFECVDEKLIDGKLYFIARKIKEPAYDLNPSYGPLFKMRRVGKNGNLIGVYKFRTMHPYAEYLQDYLITKYGYSDIGKPANDFRLTPWGKFLRRYWLDELPQLINVAKGEMKLVGVRPLSQQYFDLYDDDFKKIRLKYRPGLVPPFYVDLPKTLDEIIDSERRYLEAYDKNPFKTDWNYFWKAF